MKERKKCEQDGRVQNETLNVQSKNESTQTFEGEMQRVRFCKCVFSLCYSDLFIR